MQAQEIIHRIQQKFPDAQVTTDGEDCSFTLEVTTEAFKSMKPIERHRAIQELFTQELTSGELHALSIKTKIP